MRGREQFAKFKPMILGLTRIYSLLPTKVQHRLFVHYRKKTGNVGLVVRYALLKNLAKHVGDNVSIDPDVFLLNVQNLSVGNNVSIHSMTYIEAYGGITIGSDVSIAHGTTIMSVNHEYTAMDVPIKEQGLALRPVCVEDNVWIGAKAVILGGNTIGSGAVVGAGAVVTKDIPRNHVVAGVPARTIKERGK